MSSLKFWVGISTRFNASSWTASGVDSWRPSGRFLPPGSRKRAARNKRAALVQANSGIAVRRQRSILQACTLAVLLHLMGEHALSCEDTKMQEVIEGIRSCAALYENIELTTTIEYTRFPTSSSALDERLIRSSRASLRCVYQDEKLFFKQDLELVTVPGEAGRQDTLQGYDGRTARVFEQGVVGNISNTRPEDGRLIVPHTLVIRDLVGNFPLADFLMGGRSARRHPGFTNAEIKVDFEKDEVIDGLRCHRLRIAYMLDSWKDDRGPTVRFLWVAPDRNYLPIRTEFYNRGRWKQGANPADVGTATDVREIAPGVWFPFRVVYDVYDVRLERETGKRQVQNRHVYTFGKAELDPHYDISLFRDIPFPDGTSVYHVENGKIVRKYIQGGRNVIRPRSTAPIYFAIAGIVIIFVAGPFWTFWWRWIGARCAVST
jgi:hypothetical protein